MEKTTKITVKYLNGLLPEGLADILHNADENDLRILTVILMLANKDDCTVIVDDVYKYTGLERGDIDASLKYWRGAGLISSAVLAKSAKANEKNAGTKDRGSSDISPQPEKNSKVVTQKNQETAHRNGVVERSASLENYSSSELASIMEKRKMSAQFVDEAQRIMGKMFRTYDTGILMGIVDQLGFEEEAVLELLAYTVRKGKTTLRYTERLAMAFYDDGITLTADVVERIRRIEISEEVISKIRALFGIGERSLTTNEKKLFTTWTEKYVYDIDVIRMAYDITVDTIQKPVPKYTNSILEKWHAEGLKNADEVRRYIESQKESKEDVGAVAKSYDVEDFFEAALRRSYEEMK